MRYESSSEQHLRRAWLHMSHGLADAPSRTSDDSSTCEVAFWQRVSRSNDEAGSAAYGNRAAHATAEISLMRATLPGIHSQLLRNTPLKPDSKYPMTRHKRKNDLISRVRLGDNCHIGTSQWMLLEKNHWFMFYFTQQQLKSCTPRPRTI